MAIAHRSADGRYDQLPAFAANLVARQVAVISVGGGTDLGLARRGGDLDEPNRASPRRATRSSFGLVASLNRPGGNVTGVGVFNARASPGNDLEVWCTELVPTTGTVVFFANPTNPDVEIESKRWPRRRRPARGRSFIVLKATTERRSERSLRRFVRQSCARDALLVDARSVLRSRVETGSLTLAARHAAPAIYPDGASTCTPAA